MSTGPPAKIVKRDDDQFVFPFFNSNKIFLYRPIGHIENENVIEFFVRLCGDVLLELLHYADRCRLAKLERVGLRFHLIVENLFGEMPFLYLNLILMGYAPPRFKIKKPKNVKNPKNPIQNLKHNSNMECYSVRSWKV